MIGNKQQVQEYLKKDKDYIYECKRKQEKSIRSSGQNRYYFWVVVEIISDFHWFTPVETHLLLKQTFKLETTTDLSKSEFKAMIDLIIDLWQVKYSIKIPLPMDSWLEKSLMEWLY